MSDADAPGFWMNEITGVLRLAVTAYLAGDAMTPEEIAAMRAYLRQWIMADGWHRGATLDVLRRSIDELTTRTAIDAWIELAEDVGIDPL